MADNPANQKKFMEDVLAAEAAGDGAGYSNLGAEDGNFKLPNVDEVWKLIEQMEGLSDAERADIRENLYNPQEGNAEDFLKRMAAPEAVGHTRSEYLIFFAMITILMLVFALFGYRLYKSLTEKELKKQEKLKIKKQSKKGKKAN